MIEYYLKNNNCKQLSKILINIDIGALKKIIKDNKTNIEMFNCLLEYPNKITFNAANNAFSVSQNGTTYLYLEKIALQLNLIKEAHKLSQKIDMITINKEQIKIVNQLISAHQNFKNCYFNFPLFKLFIKYGPILFLFKKKQTITRTIKKSFGIKYYQLFK